MPETTLDAEVLEYAKNSTGNRFSGLLIDVDIPNMPEELELGKDETAPAFVEIIFTRPDGLEIRKRAQRPLGDTNAADDNEVYYVNTAGDGTCDMYGRWLYTVGLVTHNGVRIRSRQSVPFWVVRGDDATVGAGDPPA